MLPLIPFVALCAVPQGQVWVVILRGIRFEPTGWSAGLTVEDCLGTVWIEDCQFIGSENPGLVVTRCPDVILHDSLAQGAIGGPGCRAIPFYGRDGQPGLVVSASAVFAYGCSFLGGYGYFWSVDDFTCAGNNGGDGAVVWADSSLWVSDGTLAGGEGGVLSGDAESCGDGGVGVRARGTVHVQSAALLGTDGIPDWLGNEVCGSPGHVGPIIDVPGEPLRLAAPSPIREGEALSLQVEAPPDAPLWLLIQPRSAGAQLVPRFHGALLLARPIFAFRFLGHADPTGALTYSFPAPVLPAGRDSLAAFGQLFARTSAGLQLGAGTMVLTLDESF